MDRNKLTEENGLFFRSAKLMNVAAWLQRLALPPALQPEPCLQAFADGMERDAVNRLGGKQAPRVFRGGSLG